MKKPLLHDKDKAYLNEAGTLDHFQFHPLHDIAVTNGEIIGLEDEPIDTQHLTFQVKANEEGSLLLSIEDKQYSNKEDQFDTNKANDYKWTYAKILPKLTKVNLSEPNIFQWNLLSGGGTSEYLYQLINFKPIKDPNKQTLHAIIGSAANQWRSKNEYINVEVGEGENRSHTFTIKGSGLYTIKASEKAKDIDGGRYSENAEQTIFIPTINVLNQDGFLITSNSVVRELKNTGQKTVTIIINTMVETEDLTDRDIEVKNGALQSWERIDSKKYTAKVTVEDNNKEISVEIKRAAYTKKYEEGYNEAAKISWRYDDGYTPPVYMQKVSKDEKEKGVLYFSIDSKSLENNIAGPNWEEHQNEIHMNGNIVIDVEMIH